MRRRAAFPVFALAALAAACVTVNVYFPEAEVRDLSKQIEQEVRRQSAEQSGQVPPPPPPAEAPPQGGSGGGGATLLDLLTGTTPAMAQAVAQPEITNPAIRKIIDSRAARLADLRRYFDQGVIGENNKGLVEVRSREALSDLKARAEVERLVRAENTDREELYKEIAAAKNVDLSQLPRIRETYAATLRQYATPGDWVQQPDGTWTKK
jgi:uncharacterized protein YdbL (DUF1318 family)